MTLKSGHLEPVLGEIEEVVVIRGDAKREKLDMVVLGGAAEHAEDALVGIVAWTQQRAAVDRPGTGLHQTAPSRDVAQRPWS